MTKFRLPRNQRERVISTSKEIITEHIQVVLSIAWSSILAYGGQKADFIVLILNGQKLDYVLMTLQKGSGLAENAFETG